LTRRKDQFTVSIMRNRVSYRKQTKTQIQEKSFCRGEGRGQCPMQPLSPMFQGEL
jgi:hypothetical protein